MAAKNPTEQIAAGYAGSTAPNQRRQRNVATAFRYDQTMEDLAALADNDPATFDRLSPAMRMRLGFYRSAKAAAEARDNDDASETSR